MTLTPGSRIGPYEVLGPLGKGGMGEVWHGRDGRLDRDVAIKALPELLAGDEERRLRFEREAKILASLSHPNIAALHGLEEQDGQRYLVMEYVPGTTLDQRLADGALSVDDALRVCRQIAEALEAAHQKGIVHRDLKPSNVMVLPDDTVKVLDFGLARSGEGSGSSTSQQAAGDAESPTITDAFTQPGVVLGTAPYMSPEQARGRSVDKRSDIWSFGVILFECLTGARLFAGETASDTMGAVLHKQLDFDALPPDTPAMVRVLLRRCLSRDRKGRLQDIGDARIELDAAIADPSGTTLGLAVALREHRPARRGTWPWLISAAILVAATAWAAADGTATSRDAPERRPVRFSITLPKSALSRGLPFQGRPDFSPTASAIAFVSADRGSLIVHDIVEGRSRVISANVGASVFWPIFSPDGGWLAYSEREGREPEDHEPPARSVWRVRLDGVSQPERVVAQSDERRWLQHWVSDTELLFWDERAGCFLIANAATKRFEPLVGSESAGAAIRAIAQGLPFTGRVLSVPGHTDRFLMEVHSGEGRTADRPPQALLVSVSLRDGTAHQILADALNARVTERGLVVFAQGHELKGARLDFDSMRLRGDVVPLLDNVYRFDLTARGDLVFAPDPTAESVAGPLQVLRGAGSPRPLSVTPRTYTGVWCAPRGRRLLVASDDGRTRELWVIDRAAERETRVASATSPDGVLGAWWSPDGDAVMFRRSGRDAADGATSVWTVPADGSGTPTPAEFAGDWTNLEPLQWLRGGRLLARRWGEGSSRLEVLAKGRDAPIPLALGSASTSVPAPAVSPDGTWLVHKGTGTAEPDDSKRWWLTPLDGEFVPGASRLLAGLDDATQVRWSADGEELYFGTSQGEDVYRVELGTDGLPVRREPDILATLVTRAGERSVFKHWDVDENGYVVFVEGRFPGGQGDAEVILDWESTIEAKFAGGARR